ncbi:hypothetical protein Tco_0585175 [Tanacetum coccineum]
MTLAASTSTDKSLKDFDELLSTPIDFSGYILNGLKIENLTQEILLGPAFRLLKGTRSNYAELEYDFKECYKALSEKLDWENPEGGDYPFDLSNPLSFDQAWKTSKSIEDMVPNIWSPVKVAYDRYALWGISHWRQQRKSFYEYERGMQSRADVYYTKRILAVTHVKASFFARRHNQEYQHRVLAEEKMEQFGKEKSSFHDQGHQQDAKRERRNVEEVVRHRYSNPMIQPELEGSTQGYPLVSVEVLRFNTTAGNPVKKILLKLNLSDHRSILTDSKEYLKMVMEVPDSS